MRKFFIWTLFIIYAAILAKLILFKRPLGYVKDHFLYDYNTSAIKANLKHANFIPLHTIKLYLHTNLRAEYSIENLFGNVVLFVPLGILFPILFPSTRYLWKIFLVSLLTSLFFETVQLIAVLGSFDVDDLILNTAGGVLGYLMLKLISLNTSAKKEKAGTFT